MEIKGCTLEFELVPQSPMIHFQWDESGVTLRASEVKPKLDKFLEKKKGNIPQNWKIDKDKRALNYKMHITLRQNSIIKPPHKIFYGNTHNEEDVDFKEKKAVTSYPNVAIMCFDNDLLHFIKDNIWEFFVVTNFGTMQNRGFGSFIIADNNKTEKDIVRAFKDNGVKAVYKAENVRKNKDQFGFIDSFYRIMKSGYNLTKKNSKAYARSQLFNFVKDRYSMENEKKFLKLVAETDGEKNNLENKHKYVRGLIGKGEIVHTKPNTKKYVVTITHNSQKGKIDRIPSIVRFKIINSTVYILGYPVLEKIYGKKFVFRFGKPKNTSYCLQIPEKQDFNNETGFPIEEFLDYYVPLYNGEIKEKGNDMPIPERFAKIFNVIFKKVVKCK